MRRKNKIAIGDAGNEILQRAIRAQGNFLETSLINLLMLILAELNESSFLIIHFCGAILLIGRIIHAFGISQINENFKLRVFATASSFTCLTILIFNNLFIFLAKIN